MREYFWLVFWISVVALTNVLGLSLLVYSAFTGASIFCLELLLVAAGVEDLITLTMFVVSWYITKKVQGACARGSDCCLGKE